MNKYYSFFLILVFFCKTSENRISDVDESQQKKETTLYVSIDKQTINQLDNSLKKQEEENSQKKEENRISSEDNQKIAFYKKAVKEMEDQYILDKEKYNQDRKFIINFKDNQDQLEKDYEIYKKNYLKNLEEERKEKKERIIQLDPEGKMFWRIDFNSEFPEIITVKLSFNSSIHLCEVENPFTYLIIKNFFCHSKVIKIRGEDLRDINFLETLPLLDFLPKKRANYIIYQEDNQKKVPLRISNLEKEDYTIAIVEITESSILKLHLYTIKSVKYKQRYFFKTITPIDFLLSLSE